MESKNLYMVAKKYLAVMKDMEKKIPVRDKSMDWERIHMSSAARIGYILAEKRGLDPAFASCACMIHDYGRVITGIHKGHAEAGYEPVKDFLRELAIFSREEIEALALCVRDHSKKGEVGTALSEIVKDADLIDFYQYGFKCEREEQQKRLERLLKLKEF